MAISEGNVILGADIYARQGILVVGTSSSKTINLNTNATLMILLQMATAGNGAGIVLVYYDSAWKAQWIYDKSSSSNAGSYVTFSFSSNKLTISNSNTGVQLRCLIFCNLASGWNVDSGVSRTDLVAAKVGDPIVPVNLTHTKHSKNIGANTSYTIALAGYKQTPIFYFAKMGSALYHQIGFFWYTTNDTSWHTAVMSSQDRTSNPTLPTISISGTNITVTAASMDCRFSWFQVM